MIDTPQQPLPPAVRSGKVAAVGRFSIGVGSEITGMLRLLRRAASAAAAGRLERRELFLQAHALANRSIFFVVVIMAFTGAIMVLQACAQAQRVIGDLSIIGPGYLQLLTREFGPTIVALMVAARYGAGVAAELGAMTITEQVDALRMAGAEPAGYLVAPRVGGGVLGMLPLVVLGTAVAFVAGGVAARSSFGIGWDTYFRMSLVGFADVIVGLCKTLAYGVAVPLISSYAGLAARGGAAGVGRATTQAVIGSSVGVLALDLLLGAIGYLVLP